MISSTLAFGRLLGAIRNYLEYIILYRGHLSMKHMQERREDAENAESLEAKSEIGTLFFAPKDWPWNIIAAVLAIVIFVVWTSRSGLDPFVSTFAVCAYAVLALISTRFKYHTITMDRSSDYVILSFRRSGVSWKYLLYAILGAAIPILLPWFVLNTSVLNSSLPAESMMIFGMVVYMVIVPIIPALSCIPRLAILKTTLSLSYDFTEQQVANLQMNVNPLDGYWYDNRNDMGLRMEIGRSAVEYITQRLDIKFP